MNGWNLEHHPLEKDFSSSKAPILGSTGMSIKFGQWLLTRLQPLKNSRKDNLQVQTH